jgi:hypothetical protein
MKNLLLKRLLIAAGSIFLLLVLILFVHIYQVTRPTQDQDLRARQLSRIELTEKLDTEGERSLMKDLTSMKGIAIAKLSKTENAVIYELDPTVQSTDKVVSKLSKNGYPVKKFELSKEQQGKGCPVIDKSSVTYKVGSFFQSIIN